MDARPAVMRQWQDRKAISQSAPQEARKQGGDCHPHHTDARERTERANGVDWLGGFQLRGARSDQATRLDQSHPGEGAPTKPGWEHPGKDRKKVKTELNHGENWKTQPSREPQKFPRGTATLDPTVNRQNQRRKKSQLSGRDSAEATDLNRNGVKETHLPRGEKTITRH